MSKFWKSMSNLLVKFGGKKLLLKFEDKKFITFNIQNIPKSFFFNYWGFF